MATLLKDIGTFLTDNDVVEGDGVDFFRDFMPPTPINLVAVYEYQGGAVAHDTAVHRSVQVKVRGKDAEAVRAKALVIYRLLQTENLIVQFTEDRWGQVYLRQPPFKLDGDDKGVTYAFNAGITTTDE